MATRSHRPRRRKASLLAALAGATIALLGLFAQPAAAEELTVGTSAEAWYTVVPTCTAAVACVPKDAGVPPVNPFTAGTLHVARLAGTELARTYLKLDLEALPAGATPTGGTLTLPIATDPTAGTLNAEQAQIQACYMVASFTPGALGAIEEPPVPDCFTSATATLLTLPEGSSFVVDLAPFAERWAAGDANEGLALVPLLNEAPPGPAPVPLPSQETWHVALNGMDSAAAEKITASVSYLLPGSEQLPPPAPLPPAVVPGIPGYSIPGAQPPPAVTPPATIPRQAPTVLVATRGFEYAGVFVLPLVALAVGSAVSYSLTREVEPDAR
jgi:hypothetical protein